MLVEPLASDDDGGGLTWVKMPWAAVEEQLAAGPESRSIGDIEGETSVTCSRRVTGCKHIEALGDVSTGVVDVEPL